MNVRVKAQLEALPKSPGVYLFRGESAAVLYVGKAKSLRSRVRSYFQKTGGTRLGSAQLVGRIRDVETIVTGSEAEALHLEQSLVKRHRPPFKSRLCCRISARACSGSRLASSSIDTPAPASAF